VRGGIESLWALVPVKPLTRAKSRLAPVLSQPERATLVLAMLERTLEVLACIDVLSGIIVVSDDARVRLAVEEIDAVRYLRERGTGGLNPALAQASCFASTLGAGGILIVPGDLPRLSPGALRLLLEDVSTPVVVIAPDRTELGTNALLVAPTGLIPPAFGPGSFHAHVAEARRRGLEPRIIRDQRLAIDLDRPEDLSLAEGLASFQGVCGDEGPQRTA
jgi:2-phospho-L-lactate guanylyltransferase